MKFVEAFEKAAGSLSQSRLARIARSKKPGASAAHRELMPKVFVKGALKYGNWLAKNLGQR